MEIEFRPLTPVIGAEVVGIDITRPVDASLAKRMREIWVERTILVFRGQQRAKPEHLIAFTRLFGEADAHDQPQYTMLGYPEIALVSNVKEMGRYIGAPKAGRNWHSDSQYLKRPPSGSFLYAKEVPPENGETLFANMYAAYDALPKETKQRIAHLKVNHSRVRAYPAAHPERPPLTEDEKARLPDVEHPMARTHPETGRKALYVGGKQHGGSVVGLPPEEGRALVEELRAFATRPRFVYTHRWQVGDAILWDNRCTMHCALPFDEEKYRRIMYRMQISGDVPF